MKGIPGESQRMRRTQRAIRMFRRMVSVAGLGWILFLAIPPNAAAQNQKQKKEKPQKQTLEKNYREWLERDVTYIITHDERNAFLKLTTDDARDQFIQTFWELRNPNPGSPENTYKDEIYRRIAYADANFGSGANEEGWRTD